MSKLIDKTSYACLSFYFLTPLNPAFCPVFDSAQFSSDSTCHFFSLFKKAIVSFQSSSSSKYDRTSMSADNLSSASIVVFNHFLICHFLLQQLHHFFMRNFFVILTTNRVLIVQAANDAN